MTRSEPTIRPSVADDLRVMHPGDPVPSFRGVTVELDGQVVGVGGVCYQNYRPVAFSVVAPQLRKYRKTLVKVCKMLVHIFDQTGGAVYAIADRNEPTAPHLLDRLGFVPTGAFTADGETLVRPHHG